MATVTSLANGSWVLDPKVSHPLDQLRGTIRRYVVIEGLLSAAIFLAAWFAIGMLLDFGTFKVATWDWVLDAPWSLRLVVLVAMLLLLAGIVTLRILGRLTKELSYPALALVLERRFPKVLGDRLITAVELADVEGQARYGFSQEMIRQTIDEARERVGTVPVHDVFNWRRLQLLGAVAAGLVIGVIVLGYASFAVAAGAADPYRFAWRFAHVSGIFLERNLLLENTPWPRRAHLELVGFPGDERRIGRDAPELVVRAKAYRWVVADRSAPMGWRPMVWSDVAEHLDGGPVPSLPENGFRAAADANPLDADVSHWELDQIQTLGIEDTNSRTRLSAALHPDEYMALQNGLERVFATLEEKAASPSMGRRLRRLEVPENVSLTYAGQNMSGEVTLSPQQNQEFASTVPDLKETVSFVVRAEDFRTTPRTIVLVPPPMFVKISRTEYQPAYLHHAPPQGEGYPALSGLRQTMAEQSLSLTGDRTVFSVPTGTELVLTAESDTDLTAAYLQPKVGILLFAKPGSADLVPIPVSADNRTVTIDFRGDYRFGAGRTIDHYYLADDGTLCVEPVTTTPTVEFDLIIEQSDGSSAVRSRRQIMVQVVDDQPPTVEVVVDVIRKVGSVYYVTPKARIPFNPESFVRDDHGLSKVAYDVTYWPEDSDIGRALRAQLLSRSFLYPTALPSIPGVVAPVYHSVKFKDLDKGDTRRHGSFGVSRFEDRKREFRLETRQVLLSRLAAPLEGNEPPVVQKIDLKSAEEDFFDVDVLKLAVNPSEVQTRYRLDLNVVATDTNYDTGPKTGQNPEPIRLLVVSEGDLLAEINKEEETFAVRLDEALAKLAGARKKWEFVRNQNSIGLGTKSAEHMDTVKVRAQDASQDVAKARDVVQSIVREYRRIHRECQVNQVTVATRDKFGTFGNRIDRVLGETPPPVNDEERRQLAAGQLNPSTTFPETDKRIEAVLTPFNANSWANPASVSDAEQAITQLEKEISEIRKALGELQSQERLKKMLSSVIEEKKRIQKELQDWQTTLSTDLLKKEPKLSTVGAVFLTKGEAKKIKQGINWRQYDKDDVTVTITVTDKEKKPVPPEVVAVPKPLKLDFEKNATEFDYEIKAGAKEGEYTVTVKPEVGDPVVFTVTIK